MRDNISLMPYNIETIHWKWKHWQTCDVFFIKAHLIKVIQNGINIKCMCAYVHAHVCVCTLSKYTLLNINSSIYQRRQIRVMTRKITKISCRKRVNQISASISSNILGQLYDAKSNAHNVLNQIWKCKSMFARNLFEICENIFKIKFIWTGGFNLAKVKVSAGKYSLIK